MKRLNKILDRLCEWLCTPLFFLIVISNSFGLAKFDWMDGLYILFYTFFYFPSLRK